MSNTFTTTSLLEFFSRVLPGVSIIGLILFLIPKKLIEFRIILYILIFILFRDTMTPMHFWEIRPEMTIRFSPSPFMLVSLGGLSVAFVGCINLFEPTLKSLLVWIRGSLLNAMIFGSLGAVAIAAPAFFYARATSTGTLNPSVPSGIWLPLFVLTIFGNFLEEVLFRGYLQGYLDQFVSPLRAAFLSGIFFAAFHSFLAISVTSLGTPLLAFTLYEGIICGLLRLKWGLVPSIIAHGGGIFLLVSGIID